MLLSPTIQAADLGQGEVPVIPPSPSVLAKYPPMIQSATKGWGAAVKTNQLVPFLDYATPDFLNQEMAAVQELQAGKITPAAMISELQKDYTSYWSSK